MLKNLVVFEGGEGCGKTTQIKQIARYLTHHKVPFITTREPGGTPLAEELRSVMLKSSEIPDPVVEYLILTAARKTHLDEVILPALANGKIVLCDRFVHSTMVYQCMVKGMDINYFKQLNNLILGDITPQLCIYFDMPPIDALNRTQNRQSTASVYDQKDLEFHQKLRSSFLTLAQNHDEIKVVDASQSIEQVSTAIIDHLEVML